MPDGRAPQRRLWSLEMNHYTKMKLMRRFVNARDVLALEWAVRSAQWSARWSLVRADVRSGLMQGVIAGAAVAIVALPFVMFHRADRARAPAAAPTAVALAPRAGAAMPPHQPPRPQRADFALSAASTDARTVADWVARSGDNGRMPFAILDKRGARLYVFEPGARLVGTSLVLLGSAHGDDSAPGIGNKALSEIQAHERTTPAGRFVSEPGHDTTGENVVWVDYDGAVAMHRVRVVDPRERRFERIATDRIDDKRISNGCINVPLEFFDAVVQPWMARTHAVVYILPEVKPLQAVFALDRDAPAPGRLSGLT